MSKGAPIIGFGEQWKRYGNLPISVPHVTDPYPTPQMTTPEYLAALSAFEAGAIFSSSRIDLQRYLLAISQNVTFDDGIQARDIAQALTLMSNVMRQEASSRDGHNRWIVR